MEKTAHSSGFLTIPLRNARVRQTTNHWAIIRGHESALYDISHNSSLAQKMRVKIASFIWENTLLRQTRY
jgi:hypothetical protein